MNEPDEQIYFNWLYNKVSFVMNPTPSLTFYSLFKALHNTEFLWTIDGDANRAQDGLDVRREFLKEARIATNEYWQSIGCSVLEMFIALSRRAEFNTDTDAKDWFWIFLDNLGLSDFSDANFKVLKVNDIIHTFIWRNYKNNGAGGLFPLEYPRENQRRVEIWYQLHGYLSENNLF